MHICDRMTQISSTLRIPPFTDHTYTHTHTFRHHHQSRRQTCDRKIFKSMHVSACRSAPASCPPFSSPFRPIFCLTSDDVELLNHLLPVGELPLHLILKIIWATNGKEGWESAAWWMSPWQNKDVTANAIVTHIQRVTDSLVWAEDTPAFRGRCFQDLSIYLSTVWFGGAVWWKPSIRPPNFQLGLQFQKY